MYIQDRKVVEVRTVTLLGPPESTTSSSSTSTPSSAPSTTASSETFTIIPTSSFITVTSTSTSLPTDTSAPVSNKDAAGGSSSHINKGAIAGGAVGGVIFIGLCAALIWFCLRRWQFKKRDGINRGFTPMLGAEKFGTPEDSPDMGVGEERTSGGVFAQFGGYHRTSRFVEAATDGEHREPESSREAEIEDPTADAPIPDSEKSSLIAPPVSQHPALHPLPGQSAETPVYYPGGVLHPAYDRRSLPSQRDLHADAISLPGHIPEQSPEIPDFVFSPVELLPNNGRLENATPVTPQAELSAFPSPPKSVAAQLRRQLSQARNIPERRTTPPRKSSPLYNLIPSIAGPSNSNERPLLPKPHKTSTTDDLRRVPTATPKPLRIRGTTYPSPTAGGRPELPASLPPMSPDFTMKAIKPPTEVAKKPSKKPKITTIKPPKAAMPFNHISLPSPQSPEQNQISRAESTTTTYSIPIGLGVARTQSQAAALNWPFPGSGVAITSDAHHLREQPSNVSALSAVRDLHNSSAVSALSALQPHNILTPMSEETPLKHNHSREFPSSSTSSNKNEHVMSWQNYNSPTTPIVGHVEQHPYPTPESHYTAGTQSQYTTPQSQFNPTTPERKYSLPPSANPSNYPVTPENPPPHSNSYAIPESPILGLAEVSPMFSPPVNPNYQGGGLGVVSPMSFSAKTPSQQSLDERIMERESYFADLRVQPLDPAKRRLPRNPTWNLKKRKDKKEVKSAGGWSAGGPNSVGGSGVMSAGGVGGSKVQSAGKSIIVNLPRERIRYA